MKFTCDRCSAQYMISDEKVGPSGVKVRCKKCGNVIVVRRAAEVAAAEAAPAPAAPAPSAPQDGAQGGLDAELGSAFDHAFGGRPAAAAPPEGAAPAPDLGTTQAMGSEGQATGPAAASASPPATEWYVAIGQAQVGPLPLTEVKRKWEAGDVGPDSLVWRPGMGDWQPLSSQAELAGYLAPVPRGSPQPSRAEAPAARSTPQPMPAAAPAEPAAEVTWKPVGASALAALANEEIAARAAPETKPAPAKTPAASTKSLVDGLPDGGGVDPTGAIPLSIKGLEVTGEKKLERRTTIASRAEETRHKRSMTRVLLAVAAVVLLAAGGAAAWYFAQGKPAPAPAPVASAPPAPPPTAASAAPAAPPAAAPAETAAAPHAAAPAAPAPTPAVAPAPPAPAPTPAVAAAAPTEPEPAPPAAKPTARKSKPEPVAKAKPARREAPAQVAAAPPPPAPEPKPAAPTAKKKDALLDFDSKDEALDEALGGGGGSKRSVYVPPAPAGAAGLPDKLSAAQINESVASRIDSLRKCVSEQKTRDPGASGVLKLKWVIAGDGAVRDVKPLPGEYASSPFAGCITGVVKGIRFPRSATTGQEVTFPFSF